MKLSSAKWVDPALIRFKISPHDDLRGAKGGDWDLERRHPLENAVKHRSIVQRYVQCWPWEQTELFKDVYAKRIGREPVRGCNTMRELVAQYYERVDSMFEDLKSHGFRTGGPLLRLLIGRDGEVFIGNQGNHRLAMAHILKLPKVAGEILCRHSLSVA
jgi:hypothetical protein